MANTGKNDPGNLSNDRDKASQAGQKGTGASGGNMADDPQRASDRKGGQASGGQSQDADRMSGGGRQGQGMDREGEFTDDNDNTAKPGQRGGQASGGRQSGDMGQSTGGRSGNLADDQDKTKGAEHRDDQHSGGNTRKP